MRRHKLRICAFLREIVENNGVVAEKSKNNVFRGKNGNVGKRELHVIIHMDIFSAEL